MNTLVKSNRRVLGKGYRIGSLLDQFGVKVKSNGLCRLSKTELEWIYIDARKSYLSQLKELHPDTGGDSQDCAELNQKWSRVERWFAFRDIGESFRLRSKEAENERRSVVPRMGRLDYKRAWYRKACQDPVYHRKELERKRAWWRENRGRNHDSGSITHIGKQESPVNASAALSNAVVPISGVAANGKVIFNGTVSIILRP